MRDQKNQAGKETKREEKRIEEEPAQLAREQARRQTDLVREQAIQKEQAGKEARREEKRIEEEPAQLAREQARRQTDLAREQAIAEDQEAIRRKAKNQPPE